MMFKRILSSATVLALAFSLGACTPDEEIDKTPSPAPVLTKAANDWKVDASKVDTSNVVKEFPETEKQIDTLVDSALGVLAQSHLDEGTLYYAGWTEEDLEERYESLSPYLSPTLKEEADELLATDFKGQDGMVLPLLPRVAQDGLVVNYDLNPYHTDPDNKVKFLIPQETVKTYVGTSEKREHPLASVEVILVTIIPTKEGKQISFENKIVLHMIPVEGTWVLDAVNWFGNPDEVFPDEFKATLTEEEIAELRKKAEEEGAVILD